MNSELLITGNIIELFGLGVVVSCIFFRSNKRLILGACIVAGGWLLITLTGNNSWTL